MEHSFNVEIAKNCGARAAAVYQYIHDTMHQNRAANINYINGEYWVECSIHILAEYFTYLSPYQIRNALKRLIKEGLVKSEKLNQHRWDTTNWYTVL